MTSTSIYIVAIDMHVIKTTIIITAAIRLTTTITIIVMTIKRTQMEAPERTYAHTHTHTPLLCPRLGK